MIIQKVSPYFKVHGRYEERDGIAHVPDTYQAVGDKRQSFAMTLCLACLMKLF